MTDGAATGATAYGAVLEVLTVGAVTVSRRYGCIRRDQYELRGAAAFPAALRDRLAARGAITGRAALYVLDVPGEFQLTVAPGAGRALLMPRLASERPAQRQAALAIAAVVNAVLGESAGAAR